MGAFGEKESRFRKMSDFSCGGKSHDRTGNNSIMCVFFLLYHTTPGPGHRTLFRIMLEITGSFLFLKEALQASAVRRKFLCQLSVWWGDFDFTAEVTSYITHPPLDGYM